MGNLLFSYPVMLGALLALPGLWWLLRVLPPAPQKILFPPLEVLQAAHPEQPEPRRTPLWILILRIALAAAVILAMAGPRYVSSTFKISGTGPVLVIMDNGWSAAPEWRDRSNFVKDIIDQAEEQQRPIALLATGSAHPSLEPLAPQDARKKLAALAPLAFAPSLKTHQSILNDFLSRFKNAEIIYLPETSVIETPKDIPFDLFGDHQFVIASSPRISVALAGAEQNNKGMVIRVIRSEANREQTGRLIASNAQARVVGEVSFHFAAQESETKAVLELPTDLLNRVTTLAIEGERSAGATWLIGADGRRARIGLVGRSEGETDNRLADPAWYIKQALLPSVDLFTPRMGQSEAIAALIGSKVDAIILGDPQPPSPETRAALKAYCEDGGTLIRFAGPQSPKDDDTLWPVRLRADGRTLGGALDWQAPRHLAPFPTTSPFAGLSIPDDVLIRRQWLADPNGLSNDVIWAKLDDGTPLVTASKLGRGRIILFHSAADPTWSTLPVSGLFVEMMKKIATRTMISNEQGEASTDKPQAPLMLLDGFGVISASGADAEPVIPSQTERANADHPAGFYGSRDAPYAVNVLAASDRIIPASFPRTAERISITPETSGSIALAPYCLLIAIILFLIDTLVMLAPSLMRPARRSSSAGLIFLLLGAALLSFAPEARSDTLPLSPKELEGALATRLAYVITGDAALDERSRDGLSGLSLFLQERTAIEPEDPVGLDLETDTLTLYPLLYWPMPAQGKKPSAAALARLETYMRNGGLVIFDTHDAETIAGSGQLTAETSFLQNLLSGLSIPPLEEIPDNHVVMRSFYLMQTLPGRYATGKTWVEALPDENRAERAPARASDNVSSLVITSNDLASAWAIDRNGRALYPIEATIPRQREMALRAGLNLVIYALTGNYKADQIHVPALLERLGR